jgi:hypothetical protein
MTKTTTSRKGRIVTPTSEEYEAIKKRYDAGTLIGALVEYEGEIGRIDKIAETRTYGVVYVKTPVRYRRLFNICELKLVEIRLLWIGYYDSAEIIGAFTSDEKAEEAKKALFVDDRLSHDLRESLSIGKIALDEAPADIVEWYFTRFD